MILQQPKKTIPGVTRTASILSYLMSPKMMKLMIMLL